MSVTISQSFAGGVTSRNAVTSLPDRVSTQRFGTWLNLVLNAYSSEFSIFAVRRWFAAFPCKCADCVCYGFTVESGSSTHLLGRTCSCVLLISGPKWKDLGPWTCFINLEVYFLSFTLSQTLFSRPPRPFCLIFISTWRWRNVKVGCKMVTSLWPFISARVFLFLVSQASLHFHVWSTVCCCATRLELRLWSIITRPFIHNFSP